MSSRWTINRKSKIIFKTLTSRREFDCSREINSQAQCVRGQSSHGVSSTHVSRPNSENIREPNDINVNVPQNLDNSFVNVNNFDNFIHESSGSNISVESEDSVPNDSDEEVLHLSNELKEPIKSAQDKIKQWALEFNVSLNATKHLLAILRENYDPTLPTDARTLMKTPLNTSNNIVPCAGGEYYHFGIKETLLLFINQTKKTAVPDLSENNFNNPFNPRIITMTLNIDGLPLTKSASHILWPILVMFDSDAFFDNKSVYTVGLFYGTSKPNNCEEYLLAFSEEFKFLLQNGVTVNDETFLIKLRCFTCDAPARQFLKCIKSHNAYYGCEKCCIKGEYCSGIVFPQINCELRTDESFSNQIQISHHKAISPLVELGIGMISQMALDPMHLIHLGVVKKLLTMWMKGDCSKVVMDSTRRNVKIGRFQIVKISEECKKFSRYVPSEFSRRPRSLNEFEHFKAKEFRTFLLYTGPFVLKNALDENVYDNFMLLSCAIMLLSNDDAVQNVDLADSLLLKFIKTFTNIYGVHNVVYNVHCLSHLSEEVKLFGSLDSFSCFPFESYLGQLKKKLKQPRYPLVQLVNRIKEEQGTELSNCKNGSDCLKLYKEHGSKLLPENITGKQFFQMSFKNIRYDVTLRNRGVQINNDICILTNIVQKSNGKIVLGCRKFRKRRDVYCTPVASSLMGIFHLDDLDVLELYFDLSTLKKKYIIIPAKKGYFGIPLLNSHQSH